jgi:hypothetical protein
VTIVEVDAILCDHCQAADNKIFVSGGGISRSYVGAEPPHVIKVGIACVVRIPYTATNQPHKLTITLVTEDGRPAIPYVPEGMPEPGPMEVSAAFNVGRPPIIVPGEAQPWPLAANFEIGLREVGGYKFVISIDGTEVRDLPLRVAVPPAGMNLVQPQATAS